MARMPRVLALALLAAIVVSAPTLMTAVSPPNTFIDGSVASAPAVNGNFSDVYGLITSFDGVQKPCASGYQTFDGNTGVWSDCPSHSTRSLEFDDTNQDQDIEIPDDNTLDLVQNFSVACWAKARSVLNYNMMIQKWGDNNQRSWGMHLISTTYGWRTSINATGGAHGKVYDAPGLPFADNDWHFVGFTFECNSCADGTLRLFTDGAEVVPNKGTDNVVTSAFSGTAQVVIGANDFNNFHWDGWLDECVLWDDVLVEAEFTTLYNNGKPIDPLADFGNYSSSADVVSYWPLGESPDDATTGGGIGDRAGSNHGTAQNMTNAAISTDVP